MSAIPLLRVELEEARSGLDPELALGDEVGEDLRRREALPEGLLQGREAVGVDVQAGHVGDREGAEERQPEPEGARDDRVDVGGVATPSSTIVMASFSSTYCRRFRTKPGTSATCALRRPARASIRSTTGMTPGSVRSPATISTPGMNGAGLLQCTVRNRLGSFIPSASTWTGMVDVLVPMIVPGRAAASTLARTSALDPGDLGDGLLDEVDVGDRLLDRRRHVQVLADPFGAAGREQALRLELLGLGQQALVRLPRRVGVDVGEPDLEAGVGERLGDAATHVSRPHLGDLVDLHVDASLSLSRVGPR